MKNAFGNDTRKIPHHSSAPTPVVFKVPSDAPIWSPVSETGSTSGAATLLWKCLVCFSRVVSQWLPNYAQACRDACILRHISEIHRSKTSRVGSTLAVPLSPYNRGKDCSVPRGVAWSETQSREHPLKTIAKMLAAFGKPSFTLLGWVAHWPPEAWLLPRIAMHRRNSGGKERVHHKSYLRRPNTG
jgi:hypothetical protein